MGSTTCATCPTNQPCEIDKLGNQRDCPMGSLFDSTLARCVSCTSGFECKDSTKEVCPKGTKYDPLYARCVECTDVHICVYDKSGADLSPNRWCYGKDPAMTSILDLFINANRMPAYHYQYCIDCNHPDNLNMLCTFSTNYFTNQAGANLTCPVDRSIKQKVTIAGVTYDDQRFWDRTVTEYPFCIANVDLYKPQFGLNILPSGSGMCWPFQEYPDLDRSVCRVTYPGFSSLNAEKPDSDNDGTPDGTYKKETGSDKPLAKDAFYSIIERRDFGTKNLMQRCGFG